MERTPVTIHEQHRGGEVKQTRGQNAEARPRIERVAGQQAGAVVIVTAAREDQHREHRERTDQRQADEEHAALKT